MHDVLKDCVCGNAKDSKVNVEAFCKCKTFSLHKYLIKLLAIFITLGIAMHAM